MEITNIIKPVLLLSCVLLFSGWLTAPVYAADQLVEGVMVLAPVGERGSIASGAVEDTLKACLARIPDEATGGQRMLAEQSCEGEETSRKSAPVAPKF